MTGRTAALIGLELIALTDHNSCKNCPSLLAQAAEFLIQVIPGMELTTCEEVHVLCYFRDLADAMDFDAYVSLHLLPIANDPALCSSDAHRLEALHEKKFYLDEALF